MRKTIIVSAVLLASVAGTFCVSTKSNKAEVSTVKVNKSDFAVRTLNAAKSDLATAD